MKPNLASFCVLFRIVQRFTDRVLRQNIHDSTPVYHLSVGTELLSVYRSLRRLPQTFAAVLDRSRHLIAVAVVYGYDDSQDSAPAHW
jgi:hypothetical protein